MYYVYFIKEIRHHHDPGNEYIKIGVSINPEKRLKMLQTANPRDLKIIIKLPIINKPQAYLAERVLHVKFRKGRVNGEWFRGTIKLDMVVDLYVKCMLNEHDKKKFELTALDVQNSIYKKKHYKKHKNKGRILIDQKTQHPSY